MSKNLIVRICVAAVAIPVILWISYQGGGWLSGMVMLLALIGISEFLIAEGYGPGCPVFWGGLLATAVLLLQALGIVDTGYTVMVMVTAVFLVSGMLFSIGRRPPAELFKSCSRLVWGILYIGLLYPFVSTIGNLADTSVALPVSGGDALLFLFGVLWVGDTAAMGVGKALGKHKLAPAVSPNKTVEGFIGGIAGALLIGVIMCFWKFEQVAFQHVMLLALGCSIFGQLGDLVESMWKRSLGIKDSSAIIPGHGGVLDRFDSLLFAAPFMSFYFSFVFLR
jgi:phosphatidate cytidylyltransferase